MNRIEIIFIGAGDATNSGSQANQSIWIKAHDKNILCDAGPTTLYRLRNMDLKPDDLDAVIFTHLHGDHFLGIVAIDLALTIINKRQRKIIYGGAQGLQKQFENLYNLSYPSFYPNEVFLRSFQEYRAGETYSLLEEVALTPVAVKHSSTSLGYRMQIDDKIVSISGDSAWCPDLATLADQSDLFICESSHYGNVPKGQNHLCYRQLWDNKDVLTTRRLIMTHAGNEVIDKQNKLEYELARDGMRILI